MTNRKAYPSDLTDAQWEILEPFIPAISPLAVNVVYTRREIVNGILYVLRSGCPWRTVPHDLPAWGALYYYFRTWRKQGIWDQALEALRRQMRKAQGKMKNSQRLSHSVLKLREKCPSIPLDSLNCFE